MLDRWVGEVSWTGAFWTPVLDRCMLDKCVGLTADKCILALVRLAGSVLLYVQLGQCRHVD